MQNCQPSTSRNTMPDHRPSLVAPVPGSPASTRAVILDSLLDASAASEMPSPPCSPSHPGPAPPGSPVASVVNLSQIHEMPGRPQRKCRLPARYRDCLPEPAPAVVLNEPTTETQPLLPRIPSPSPTLPRIRLIVRDTIKTMANIFGLW